MEDEKHLAQQCQLAQQLKFQFGILEKRHNFSFAINEVTSKLEITQPQLLLLIRQGEIAKKVLARANSRLLYHIAEFFRRKGTPMSTLMRYASEGLVKAIDRFDPERGFRFSTYASWWIKQAVARNLYGDKITASSILMKKIRRFETSFLDEHGRSPSIYEISEGLGVSIRRLTTANQDVRVKHISFDSPVYRSNSKMESSKRTVTDITPSIDIQSTSESYYDFTQQFDDSDDILEDVPEKDADILAMRWGLNGEEPISAGDVGRYFNTSEEKIRELETIALLYLKMAKAR